MSSSRSLTDALAAARAKDFAAVRDALIAAWRKRPSPIVAELITLVEAVAPDALTAQIAALVTPRVATTLERFMSLKGVDDPRVQTWCIDALAKLPFTAETSKELYLAVAARAEGDPRLAPKKDAIRAAVWTRINRLAVRQAVVKRVEKSIASTPALRADPASQKLEGELVAELEPLRKTSRSADSLLAEIYANPEDDAPRIVYADLLTEQGDPRGEFITLQLENAEPSAREVELLKQHGKAWLGNLAPVISFGKGYSGSAFRRGFLARADIILSVNKKLEPIREDPAWATVEQVEGYRDAFLLRWAPLRALRTLVGLAAETMAEALAAGRTLPGLRRLDLQSTETHLDAAQLRRFAPNLVTIAWRPKAVTRDNVLALAAYGTPEIEINGGWRDGQLTEARTAFEAAVQALVGCAVPSPLERARFTPPFSRGDVADPIVLTRGADGRLA